MQILLVQVPTSHLGAGERVYPLGLSRLARLIRKPYRKQGLDMNLCADPWAELNETLTDVKPEIVALSFRNLDPLAGHHASYLSSLRTGARMVRHVLPEARIWAGGPAFSLFPKRLMDLIPEIDCGLVGEGEVSFHKLLSECSSPEAIPGLIWRNKDRIEINPAGDRISMDSLPKTDLKTFCPENYTKGNKYVAAVGIEGKRGCDLHCAYCVYPRLGGTKMRLRNPARIADEMEHFSKAYDVSLFHFTDSVVNRPPDHFEAVCREISRRKLGVSWTGFFREDSLSPELLELARKAGLAAVYFSADALTEHGLKLLSKRLTRKQILQAARMTAKSGILTMCHFLVNLPGETLAHLEEARRMLDQILEIHGPAGNLGAVIFNTVRLYPDAPLTRRLLKNGQLNSQTDLLYPVYHNPPEFAHTLHEFEAHCHTAGVFSRLGIRTHSS